MNFSLHHFIRIMLLTITGLSGIVHSSMAQWTSNGTHIYNSNTGNVGIGTASPSEKLHVTGNTLISGAINVPGTGTYSQRFGPFAVASGTYATSFGYNASAAAEGTLAIGYGANAGGFGSTTVGGGAIASNLFGVAIGYAATTGNHIFSVAIGGNAQATGANAVAIGYGTISSGGVNIGNAVLGGAVNIGSTNTLTGYNGSLAIGHNLTGTANNQILIGANLAGYFKNEVRFNGVSNGMASSYGPLKLWSLQGSGTNIAGQGMSLYAGAGTGSANGGDIAFYTAAPGAAGAALNTYTDRLRITSAGNLGVGTAAPTEKLHVSGSFQVDGNAVKQVQFTGTNPYNPGFVFEGNTSNTKLYTFRSQNLFTTPAQGTFFDNYFIQFYNNVVLNPYQQPLFITRKYPGVGDAGGIIIDNDISGGAPAAAGYKILSAKFSGTEVASINGEGSGFFNGKMGIGTTTVPYDYKLAVNGKIIAEKLRVQAYAIWPDYVFQQGYSPMPLAELEHFIKQNKHLPEIPSAVQVEKEGLDLGDNQALLLKKIEELTLYLIEQDKRMKAQEQKIENLQSENSQIKKKLENK